jgi:hypothetical protein
VGPSYVTDRHTRYAAGFPFSEDKFKLSCYFSLEPIVRKFAVSIYFGA